VTGAARLTLQVMKTPGVAKNGNRSFGAKKDSFFAMDHYGLLTGWPLMGDPILPCLLPFISDSYSRKAFHDLAEGKEFGGEKRQKTGR
jgi:hypothetical protein